MKDGELTNPKPLRDPDAVLDRCLGSLPTWDPEPGFDSRVMLRVRIPEPPLVQSVQRVGNMRVVPRRIWWLVGALAATSALCIVVVSAILVKYGTAVGGGLSWAASNVGIPAWRASLGMVADLARDCYAVLMQQQLSTTAFVFAAVSSVLFLGFNSWMLYRLMQPAFMRRRK